MFRRLFSLSQSTTAAREVVFPLPVGLRDEHEPRASSASLFITGGSPSSSKLGIFLVRTRLIAIPIVPRCLNTLALNLPRPATAVTRNPIRWFLECLAGLAGFRANVFKQRGTIGISDQAGPDQKDT